MQTDDDVSHSAQLLLPAVQVERFLLEEKIFLI
jgi:hypothetical protein